jgi:uncharacterized membrane protein YdbT with pleckstrin-like domain
MVAEDVIWKGTPSQLINIKCYLFCGALFWVVVPLFVMFWQYLKVKSSIYEFTSERLIIKKGIFNKLTDQVELYRVKDIRLEEPFLMRIFGLGNIVLVTSDKTLGNILLPAMRDAENLKDKIRHTVEKLREKKNVREMDFK